MNVHQFNRIVEIRTKIISMGTFLSATLYTYVNTGTFHLNRFLLMAAAVLFIDMGTTGFNSFFDYVRGTDTRERNFEKDKVLVHEDIPPLTALLVSVVLFFLAALLGFIIAGQTSYFLILIGALSMTIGFLYTGGPVPISRTPLGELFAGGFLGSVLFMISVYVASGNVSIASFLVSLPHLLLIAMILSVNNTCDKESDTAAGRHTLTICLTEKANRILLTLEWVSAYLASVLLSLWGLLPRWMLITAPLSFFLSWRVYRNMVHTGMNLKTKGVSMVSVSRIFLLYIGAFMAAQALQLIAS